MNDTTTGSDSVPVEVTMNDTTIGSDSVPVEVTKGPSQHPYLEWLRDGDQNRSLVFQEKLDWSWMTPKDTSKNSTEEPRMRHHFTISELIKNTPQRKRKLRPLKISKNVVKSKE